MPGGYFFNPDKYEEAGETGNWWSSTSKNTGEVIYYILFDDIDGFHVFECRMPNEYGYSVRCVTKSKVSKKIKTEILHDMRDGKSYKTTNINGKIWMAENLDYKTDIGSWDANHGRLYNWEIAQNTCPSGWHLPSLDEFTDLFKFYGESEGAALAIDKKVGFLAQPDGYRDYDGEYYEQGGVSYLWSSTTGFHSNMAGALIINCNHNHAEAWMDDQQYKLKGCSVRCIKN